MSLRLAVYFHKFTFTFIFLSFLSTDFTDTHNTVGTPWTASQRWTITTCNVPRQSGSMTPMPSPHKMKCLTSEHGCETDERNLYGHPLAGLLWEKRFEKGLLEHGWEKVPNLEIACSLIEKDCSCLCKWTIFSRLERNTILTLRGKYFWKT